MAEIIFKCSECGIDIKIDEYYRGGTAKCPHCSKEVMVPTPTPGTKEGMELGGYILKRLLGEGGMGEVWLAEDPMMKREIALKILSPALTDNEHFIERFMAEIKLSAKLEHPNIVTAFDAGCQTGSRRDLYYLAVSLVEGTELQTFLELEKKIDEKKALKIVKALAGALEYAWDEHEILHRDIKPANIMLDNKGKPHLMDMGISKSMSEEKELTLTGVVLGTPHYMSPEQARSTGKLDCRSDIYSLGATLYHMVTGSVPYDASSTVGILSKLITDPFPPPQQRNPELSDEIAVLIETMMAKDADNRQQTWGDVIYNINLVLKGQFPATKRPEDEKYVIKRENPNQQLLRTEILKNAPKAKFRKNAQQHSEDYSSPVEQTPKKSKVGLFIIGLGLAAVLIIAAIRGLIIFPEEEKTESKPKPKSKKVQAVRPAATKKKAKEKAKEMFEFAVNYAKKHPANFAESIEYFERAKKSGKGTLWSMKADSEIRRLRSAEKALAEKKRLATIEKRNFTKIASSLIIDGKFRDADKLYQNIKSETLKKELAPTGKILAELAKSKKTILNSFEKQKGKIIAIVLNGKKQKIKIEKVSSKSITAKTKHNKIWTSLKFHVNDLVSVEQIRRLRGLSRETKYIYAGVFAVKEKKLSMAESYFKNTVLLRNMLLAECDELSIKRKLTKRIHEARTKTGKVLSVNPDNIKEKLKELKPGMVLRFEPSKWRYGRVFVDVDNVVIEGNEKSKNYNFVSLSLRGNNIILRNLYIRTNVSFSGKSLSVVDCTIVGFIRPKSPIGDYLIHNSILSFRGTKCKFTKISNCTIISAAQPIPVIIENSGEYNFINCIIYGSGWKGHKAYAIDIDKTSKAKISMENCLIYAKDFLGAIAPHEKWDTIEKKFTDLSEMRKWVDFKNCSVGTPEFKAPYKDPWTPFSFKLKSGSPGKGAGPDGRDLGANIGKDGMPVPYK